MLCLIAFHKYWLYFQKKIHWEMAQDESIPSSPSWFRLKTELSSINLSWFNAGPVSPLPYLEEKNNNWSSGCASYSFGAGRALSNPSSDPNPSSERGGDREVMTCPRSHSRKGSELASFGVPLTAKPSALFTMLSCFLVCWEKARWSRRPVISKISQPPQRNTLYSNAHYIKQSMKNTNK